MLHLRKCSSEASITVWSADRSAAFGYGCGTSLGSGAFLGHPIAFDVDENGVGNLSVGRNRYTIHEDPAVSGAITCVRITSDAEAFVTCSVGVPADVSLTPLDQSNLVRCFSAGTFHLASVFAGLESGASTPINITNLHDSPAGPAPMSERQGGPCSSGPRIPSSSETAIPIRTRTTYS